MNKEKYKLILSEQNWERVAIIENNSYNII